MDTASSICTIQNVTLATYFLYALRNAPLDADKTVTFLGFGSVATKGKTRRTGFYGREGPPVYDRNMPKPAPYVGGMSTPTQLRKIHHALDFADPADVVAGCSATIGREITAGRDMTYTEAAHILAVVAMAGKAAG